MDLAYAIVYCIVGFAFAIFCLYMAYRKATEGSRLNAELQSAQAKQRTEFQTVMSPYYGAMRSNYYTLHRTITPPVDSARIDLETTVFGLPCKAQAVGGKLDNLLSDFHFWYNNNTLYIFPSKDHLEEKHILYRTTVRELPRKINPQDIRAYVIPVDNIEYFSVAGDERRETHIAGGESTGVNVPGAIVGGLIAGDAGVIIGGQPKQKPIYSYNLHFDNRFVELLYTENAVAKKLKLSITSYPLLEKWMPHKEYSYVQRVSNSSIPQNKFDEIKHYKELLDSGIITMEEFERKKAQILEL